MLKNESIKRMIDFFYSDPHLGHANIIKYCDRPFSDVHEMNKELTRRYNAVVRSDDTVFWLGDCCFKGHERIIEKFNGRKILIVGNHDRSDAKMSSFGFEIVTQEAVMNIGGITCRLSHYPYLNDEINQGGKPNRHIEKRPKKNKDEILIHGHNHSTVKITSPTSISVGVDAWDFSPAFYSEVEHLVKTLARNH